MRTFWVVWVCFCFEVVVSLPFVGSAQAQPSEATRENYSRILTLIQQDNDPAVREIQAKIRLDENLEEFSRLDDAPERARLVEEVYRGIQFLVGDALGRLDGKVLGYCQNIDRQMTTRVRTGEVTVIQPKYFAAFAGLNFFTNIMIAAGLKDPAVTRVLVPCAFISIPMYYFSFHWHHGFYRNPFVRTTYMTVTEREKELFLSELERDPALRFPRAREVFDYVELLLNRKMTQHFRLSEIEETVPPTLVGFDE